MTMEPWTPGGARRMRWSVATTGVVLLGLALPFLVRISLANPGDTRLLRQYSGAGLSAILFLEALNLIPIAAAALSTMVFRRFNLWLIPVGAGYAYVGFWHARLDLSSDAQASIGLVVIPVLSVQYFLGGALAAALSDFCLHRWSKGR